MNLVLDGKLNTLKVCELDKYIDENKLSKKGKKKDKLSAITADILRKSNTGTVDIVLEEFRAPKVNLMNQTMNTSKL